MWPAATRVWAFAAVHGRTVGVQKHWMEVLGGHVAEEREERELEEDVGRPEWAIAHYRRVRVTVLCRT